MKRFLKSCIAFCITTVSTAMLSSAISLSTVLPVAAKTFDIQGMFSDKQPFSGFFLVDENGILVNYNIEVGSAIIPTQDGDATLPRFTYSSNFCDDYGDYGYCVIDGLIENSTSLKLNSLLGSGGDFFSRSFTFNLSKILPTDNSTISGNAFESFYCSRCGGNVESGFDRSGIGTVTAVPEPSISLAVLTTGILGTTIISKRRKYFRYKQQQTEKLSQ